MKPRAFFRALRLRGWSVALITLAAVALSLAYTLIQVPLYASTAHLFVAAGDSGAKQGNQSQFAEQRIRSYVEVFDGDTIARRVIKRLNLNETPRELSDQIHASADAKSVVLSVRVKDPSAERAQLLADTVAKEFIAFLGELETSASDTAPIKATLVDAPDKPTKPATPNVPLNLGIGLGVGLLLGLLWAWVRERSDTTVRTPSVLEDATDAPVLGAILFDENSFDEPTIRTLDHYDPRVEGYRVLRTSLEFLKPERRDGAGVEAGGPPAANPETPTNKVYVVTSAVPGEGKTTTAINLALILAEGGEKVALVEADLRRPTISEYLDLNPATGLTTTLIGRTTLAEAVQEVGALDVLTSGRRPPNPAELVKSQAMRTLIEQLREQYSYVLIDAPPLLPVTDASLLAATSDGVILVTRYGDTKDVELGAAMTRLKSVNAKVVGSILNMTPASDVDGYGYGYGYAPEEQGHGHAPGHDAPRERPRKPKKAKAPKKADVVVEAVPYASLLARLEPTAAPVIEAEPAVDANTPGPTLETTPAVEPVETPSVIDPDSIQSGQSLLEQIEQAMARAVPREPTFDPDPPEVESTGSTPADDFDRFAARPAQPAGDEPTGERDSTVVEEVPAVVDPEESEAEPAQEAEEPADEPDTSVVAPVETTPTGDFDPEPPVAVTPEPERPMVWPASWAVQTARSFVESDHSGDDSATTTHRFPGVETARSFVESDSIEEPEAPVIEPAETEPDEEDLVAEAEPTFEPTETTD